jgi:hypothetical protein
LVSRIEEWIRFMERKEGILEADSVKLRDKISKKDEKPLESLPSYALPKTEWGFLEKDFTLKHRG